jgi:acyl carrier protein
MRIASRHMPKFKRKPVGPVAFIFLATFACGTLYMALSVPLVASIVLALLSLAFFLARQQTKRGEKQLRALAEMRAGESICEFAREFDIREVDSWIVRAVYEQIQGQLQHVHSSFPVRASDRLKEDLHLDDDDLDMDLAVQIEQRTGRSIDDTNANPYFGKVKTVRDLVLFFQFQPKQTVI